MVSVGGSGVSVSERGVAEGMGVSVIAGRDGDGEQEVRRSKRKKKEERKMLLLLRNLGVLCVLAVLFFVISGTPRISQIIAANVLARQSHVFYQLQQRTRPSHRLQNRQLSCTFGKLANAGAPPRGRDRHCNPVPDERAE